MGRNKVADTPQRSRDAECARAVQNSFASEKRGRRESRVPIAPAASRAKLSEAHERSHHRFTGTVQPSLRNGFNGCFVLSPATGLFCHRRLRIISANLTPASGCQDHTT